MRLIFSQLLVLMFYSEFQICTYPCCLFSRKPGYDDRYWHQGCNILPIQLRISNNSQPKYVKDVQLFALTLQTVNQNAVHMNIIVWLGFLFRTFPHNYVHVHSFSDHILQHQRKQLYVLFPTKSSLQFVMDYILMNNQRTTSPL